MEGVGEENAQELDNTGKEQIGFWSGGVGGFAMGHTKYRLVLFSVIIFFISIFWFTNRNKSDFPLDGKEVRNITFNVYPQDIPCYSITDHERILDIISALNEMERTSPGYQINHLGDYYLLTLEFMGGKQLLLELDENGFFLNDENYMADTEALRILLEQTYYDRQGKIE